MGGIRLLRPRLHLLALGALLLLPGDLRGEPPALPAPEILRRAFANQYGCGSWALVELVTRAEGGAPRTRRLVMASRLVDGRFHAIGQLVDPPALRGMTFLMAEPRDGVRDAFVFLPSLGRVRRISLAQRGESFLGTDVTYADLERRRVRDFEVFGARAGEVGGEPVHVVRARPRRPAAWVAIDFAVAIRDFAILEQRAFARGEDRPFRVLQAPRSRMVEGSGHVLPGYLRVVDRRRRSTTEVTFRRLRIAPELDPELFLVTSLERGGRLRPPPEEGEPAEGSGAGR